jgi:hypothetical protein
MKHYIVVFVESTFRRRPICEIATRTRASKSVSHLIRRRKLYPTAARMALLASPWRPGEIVSVHAVLVLEMADDGLDGGAAPHLAFDVYSGVVAAVTDIGMEPLDRALDRRDDTGEDLSVVGGCPAAPARG